MSLVWGAIYMKKPKKCYFKVPVVNAEYFVFVCIDTREGGLRRVKKYFKDTGEVWTPDIFEVRGKTFRNSAYNPLIWIDVNGKDFLSTVAHEACHAMIEIFNYIDQDITKAEEVFALNVGFIVKAVIHETK